MAPTGDMNGPKAKKGEFITTTKAIADFLEQAAPVIVKQVEEAEPRDRERQKQAAEERRLERAGEGTSAGSAGGEG